MLCHNGNKQTQDSQHVGMTKHHMGDMKSSDTKISSDTDTHVVITPLFLTVLVSKYRCQGEYVVSPLTMSNSLYTSINDECYSHFYHTTNFSMYFNSILMGDNMFNIFELKMSDTFVLLRLIK